MLTQIISVFVGKCLEIFYLDRQEKVSCTGDDDILELITIIHETHNSLVFFLI